ncbi:MAG: 50S ribosomal protein L24 [Legionella sp.]|nr:50S ribosomal protein L24 [Legionella sp.]
MNCKRSGRIISGDEVIIIAGKSKGHVGKVLRVKDDRIFVQGGNLSKKHVKNDPQQPEKKGGIVTIEASIHQSNIALYNPSTNKADKVGFKFLDNDSVKKKVRYFKSNNELVGRV